MSIRESLRVLRLIERQQRPGRGTTAAGPRLSLEALCFEYGRLQNLGHAFVGNRGDYTCGNFMNCFVSLFVARRDMTTTTLDYITNGSPLHAFLNHSNILSHAYGASHSLSKWLSNLSSRLQLARLCERLFSRCSREHLPRVFLCSLTIVSPKAEHRHIRDAIDDTSDHKWVIIKYSNSNYQFLQGYIKAEAGVSGAAASRPAQSLHQWQCSSNPYGSARGASRQQTRIFTSRLLSFATDDKFDCLNYTRMFSQRLDGLDGAAYFPSLSYQEIDDACVGIRGFGARDLASHVERRLRERLV